MKCIDETIYSREIVYTIRHAVPADAAQLSGLRLTIDGETENMDRNGGEMYLDVPSFKDIIEQDITASNHLFLIAEIDDQLVGFSRCEGSPLQRKRHQAEFGVCILKKYWGYGIGSHLLRKSIEWADKQNLLKLTLSVLCTNKNAIHLYKKYGFIQEGILRKDKLLKDGKYYDTVLMARFSQNISW